MRVYLCVLTVLLIHLTQAQTGIGTTTPDPSAKLEVSASNKGFLPPRVTLTSYMDNTTISNPATGLLVYNTGTNANLAAGYYYWNGSAWATIATAGGSGSFAASFMRGSRTAAQSGLTQNSIVVFTQVENNSGADISLNTTTGKITLSPGITYRLVAGVPNFYGGRPAFMWYNETTSSYIGNATNTYSPSDAASNGAFGGTANVIITPNVTTVLSFRLLSNSSTSASGNGDFPSTGSYPWFEAQVISGNAPVTGQSVDYVQASLSANQTLSSAGNIVFNTSSGAGITLTSGGFNLIANKTYKLEAALGGTSGGYAYYGWVDSANTLLSGGSIGTVMKAGSAYSDAPQDKAVVFYTPTANTTVYLRVLTVSGGVTAYAPNAGSSYSSTWATIQQVGSSAIVNPWVLSGNDVYNTSGKVGIGTSSPATTLDVNGTLNLSNTTTTPSINVKNGDAAATFNDNAQIKMGWAGSAAGASQYAQFIHTRHNAGPTNNAIDFYLSDGTANNTITTGSTRAMSISSPGDVEITGKLTIGNANGNVATKVSGLVNAGTFLTLDNLKVSVTTGGSRGLSIATVTGSFVCNISGWYAYGGSSGSSAENVTYTTTPSGSVFGWSFGAAGNTAQYHIIDLTNNRFYRVTIMIGSSYINNFMSIERLY